jgi:hypothetical protein
MFEAKFSDLGKLTVRVRQRAQEMGRAVLRVEVANQRQLKAAAITLSSGPYSTAALQEMRKDNHGRGPYSRVSPNPPAPPFIINKQSKGFGSISQMWQTRLTNTPDGTQVTLYNTSPHMSMFRGTLYAIPRPILQAVITATKADREARLRGILSKVMR